MYVVRADEEFPHRQNRTHMTDMWPTEILALVCQRLGEEYCSDNEHRKDHLEVNVGAVDGVSFSLSVSPRPPLCLIPVSFTRCRSKTTPSYTSKVVNFVHTAVVAFEWDVKQNWHTFRSVSERADREGEAQATGSKGTREEHTSMILIARPFAYNESTFSFGESC